MWRDKSYPGRGPTGSWMQRLRDKGAVITGGASGIGLATARRLAAEGARIFVVDRNPEGEQAVRSALDPASLAGYSIADVSSSADVARAVAEAESALGRLDVLVNNAGIWAVTPFLAIAEEEWDRIVSTDLKGIFLVGQAVARRMVASGGGVIINTASTSGLVADHVSPCAHYSAAKAGIISLTKQMGIELAPHGIRVNAVCPGSIATTMSSSDYLEKVHVPLARRGTPDEVAAVFAFLASDDASYLTGAAVVVDGGLTLD